MWNKWIFPLKSVLNYYLDNYSVQHNSHRLESRLRQMTRKCLTQLLSLAFLASTLMLCACRGRWGWDYNCGRPQHSLPWSLLQLSLLTLNAVFFLYMVFSNYIDVVLLVRDFFCFWDPTTAWSWDGRLCRVLLFSVNCISHFIKLFKAY